MRNEVKGFYQSGNLKFNIIYVDGMKNGRSSYYYENGKIKSTIDYCDNLIDGYIRSYYEDGSLESQETYTKGQRNNDLQIFNYEGINTNYDSYDLKLDYIHHY